MSYPPGSSGYPPPQQQPGPYGSSTPSFAKSGDGDSANMPAYLSVAVLVLGLAAYLGNFGPMYDIDSPLGNVSVGGSWTSAVALLAALLAGVSLLPKGKNYTPIVAVIAVLGALLAISNLFDKPGQATVGWGLWAVLGFTVVQAIVALGLLLLEAGVITPPAPKPAYPPYGVPPGYYGHPGGQQPGYSPYGGGYPSGPSGGGFGAPSAPSPGGFSSGPPSGQHGYPGQPGQPGQPGHSGHQGPPTPPTGFPSFSQPSAGGQAPGSGTGSAGSSGGDQQAGEQTPQAPSSTPPGSSEF